MNGENNLKINRFNYEEYFLLYIDNELNASERAEVESFAAGHPDLGAELKLLLQSVVRPDSQLQFQNKESLLKAVDGTNEINSGNDEEYFVAYLDDELTVAEKAAVEAYLYAHPERESVFESFQQVQLQPEKIVFAEKDKLFRHEKVRRIAPFPWWRVAAAAAVVIIGGWIWLNGSKVRDRQPELANIRVESNNSNKVTAIPGKPIDHPVAGTSDQMVKESPSREGLVRANRSPEKLSGNTAHTLVGRNNEVVAAKAKNKKLPVDNKHALTGRSVTSHLDVRETVEIGQAVKAGREKPLPLVAEISAPQVPEDNMATLSFASDHQSENVFLTNIPLSNNVPLRGLFRKASRVMHKVVALKNGSHPGISIGNVEIKIQ